jgi:hypothetical protein
MAKKIRETKNISEFSSYKELERFKKKRSPHTLVFLTNDPDEWFIDCIEYRSKSGVVIHDDLIIAKDLLDWIRWHKSMGWKEV